MQTTNLLLQAGAEALKVAPGAVPSLAPLRTIRELHRRTARDLGFGTREDIEGLLSEVQQLLVGISIMQVRCRHLPLLSHYDSSQGPIRLPRSAKVAFQQPATTACLCIHRFWDWSHCASTDSCK